ncbi:MAG TPA: hypothetical protein DCG42_00780 [Maribacter sp.]|uniref:DUF5723 family protein n=1 Tax=unclassified Maribacter TaxID=2615042 RepID=UPI000EEE2654|nr:MULTISPECIES: DUF5723 family protein [unclassified Maribacter]HAF75829.1 hypothetical protein [Maribacter sp.]|tara:strand:- start:1722 stop:3068 length:1347 start_codon:yes stop_codon:yes gene_type:complete
MRNFLILLTVFASEIALSQNYVGYDTDNYSGIHAILNNPGALADSRTKSEVSVLSVGSILATDYANLTLENLNKILGDDGFEGSEKFPSNKNEIVFNAEILGPSFIFSLNEKSSVGLISRLRIESNFNNVNGELFEGIYEGFPANNFNFQQENLDFTTHAWAEIGISYGRVLFSNTHNLFKGGTTIKYLIGGGAVQGISNSLAGNYDNTNNQVALTGDFTYAISYSDEQDSVDYFNELSSGIGADFGFVYEYRSNSSIADSNANNPRGFNQYKLKIGLSIIDIGSIAYDNGQITDYIINGNVSAQELEEDFIETLDNNASQNKYNESFKVSLPTSMHLNIDYNLHNKFYLNLNVNQNLVEKNAYFNNNRINLITFTPRYETRIFGAYLPVSTGNLGKTALGAGIRLGPLFVGSSTIFSNISKQANLANVYVGLKISKFHKRKIKTSQL